MSPSNEPKPGTLSMCSIGIGGRVGGGIETGAMSMMLLTTDVVRGAVHAYAFGSHGAGLFPEHAMGFRVHVLTAGVLAGLFLLKALCAALLRGSGPGRRGSCGP